MPCELSAPSFPPTGPSMTPATDVFMTIGWSRVELRGLSQNLIAMDEVVDGITLVGSPS